MVAQTEKPDLLDDEDTHVHDGKRWSNWPGERDPTVLRVLGKLGEECGELNTLIGRCVAQGLSDKAPARSQDPKYNGEANTLLLAMEIGDVIGWCRDAITRFGLDEQLIRERANRKQQKAAAWLGDPHEWRKANRP